METYKIQVAVIECNEDGKEGKTQYVHDKKLKSNVWAEVSEEFYGIYRRAGERVRMFSSELKAGKVYLRVRMIKSFAYPECKMCKPDGTAEIVRGTETTEYFYIDLTPEEE